MFSQEEKDNTFIEWLLTGKGPRNRNAVGPNSEISIQIPRYDAHLAASGDSMPPTIAENDLMLVDERIKRGQDGIYAFVQDDFARVKRFKFMPGGRTEIVSDNADLYKPVTYSNR